MKCTFCGCTAATDVAVVVLQLEQKHDVFNGNGPLDVKRRNALTNALIDLLGEKSGADLQLARECLYAIAPPQLWQFYSAKGLSGSCKSSFSGRMMHLYQAVLVAVATRTGKEKSVIVTAISEVLKTVHNRSGPHKYRKEHPEEVLRHSLGQLDEAGSLVADFTKKSVKGPKRRATSTTSKAAGGDDSGTAAADGGSLDAQYDQNGFHRKPTRNARQSVLRLPSVDGSDEEKFKQGRYESDDSDF